MANPTPLCTHVKTDGVGCGSPAVSETEFCYHHSAVKTALGKVRPQSRNGEATPIPFVFPEDRASMQINFFLLLQAFNEGRVDLRTFKAMMSMLKSMAANLGKTGSLVEEASDQRPAVSDQENRAQGSGRKAQKNRDREDSEEDESESGAAGEGPFEFGSEMMAEFEEIERLSPNDPGYAERVRAAVAEGLGELRAHGIDVMEISNR